MRADCFVRTWNRVRARRRVWCVTIEVAPGAPLAEIIAAARAAGVNAGTGQTGLFEVQTDEGIWSRVDGNRLDASTPRRLAACVFQTWEQLEAEEVRAS